MYLLVKNDQTQQNTSILGSFMNIFFLNKNIKIPLLIFFFTFTLLSYIEINIDFRQTALGCHS